MSRIKERLVDSKLADVARAVLPESIKLQLRQLVRGEKAQYPLQEPVTVSIGTVEAKFWIRNHSDWYRIRTQSFERDYGLQLIEAVIEAVIASSANPQLADIGSAQGYYSILAAKAGAEVSAFDPDPISQESLVANLSINADVADKIHQHEIALGDKEGELALHIDKSGTYAPSLVKTVRGLKEKIQVPVTTMDIMIANGQIKQPDIVKIDVEGAEGLVLAGMKGTLTSERKPKHIFIELHNKYLPRFGSSPEEVQALIAGYGYRLEICWDRRGELLCHYTSS